jgi:hypothetical protein
MHLLTMVFNALSIILDKTIGRHLPGIARYFYVLLSVNIITTLAIRKRRKKYFNVKLTLIKIVNVSVNGLL